MRIPIIFFLITSFFIDSCGNNENPSKFFEIQMEGKKNQFQNGDEIGIAISNKKEKEIKEITYFLEGQKNRTSQWKSHIAIQHPGNQIS